MHVVGVALDGDGFKSQSEHCSTFEATLRHRLQNFARGLRATRHYNFSVHFHWRRNARSELVAGVAPLRPYRIRKAHGDAAGTVTSFLPNQLDDLCGALVSEVSSDGDGLVEQPIDIETRTSNDAKVDHR